MVNPSAFAADGGDPRLHGAVVGQADYVAPRIRKLHDSSIMFEEYLYYAELTRAEEDAGVTSSHADGEKTGVMSTIFSSKSSKVVKQDSHDGSLTNEKMAAATQLENHHQASDDEWTNAARALRTATASAIFYLITTDILGPFGVPSGWMLWKIFLGLDSYHYPLNTYGDLAFRIYGRTARYLMNSLQTIQLLCNVGAIIIANGQALSQVSKFKLCYAVCCLIWAIAGFAVGQVRTLQKYGWLANLAIWLNLLIIFMTMGVAAHSTPNYAAAQGASAGAALGGDLVKPDPTTGAYPPIVHFAGLPDPGNFIGAINGLMQGVYAYGGAMVFIEFMSEMKRPRDFLKGMAAAQLFIYFFYMLYGLFMYAYQGQYAVNPSYQGIEPYAWQSAGNVIAIVSGLIAAGLYGNIGVKVLYNNILIEFLHAPPLTSKKGKILWAAIIPVYWTLAFIIAASIPNFFGLTSLVAAVCILQFTYTFPPLLYLGYAIKKGAMLPGEGFDPATGRVVRHDAGVKRWARGFTKGAWYLNVWNIIYMLGAGVTAGLGAYSAIEALIAAFAQPQIGAFTCHSPLDNA
ncbi:hypothetical protein LTR28_010934 [Elasticomyces elasticus]|nr:hypothetical protein LTR28_010934 [Elasticomyces elasticus]